MIFFRKCPKEPFGISHDYYPNDCIATDGHPRASIKINVGQLANPPYLPIVSLLHFLNNLHHIKCHLLFPIHVGTLNDKSHIANTTRKWVWEPNRYCNNYQSNFDTLWRRLTRIVIRRKMDEKLSGGMKSLGGIQPQELQILSGHDSSSK